MENTDAAATPDPGLEFDDTTFDERLKPRKSGSVRYCWMKVVKNEKDIGTFGGHRPPNAFVSTYLQAAPVAQATLGVVESVAAKDVEVFYAVDGRWPKGKSKYLIVYGPAFAIFDQAEDWFENSPEAQAWKQEAESFTLFAFAQLQGYGGPHSNIQMLAASGTAQMKCGSGVIGGAAGGKFPDTDWQGQYRPNDEPTHPKKVVFEESILFGLLDSDWDQHPKEVEECKLIKPLVDEQRTAKEGEIIEEAKGLGTIGEKLLAPMKKTQGKAWEKLEDRLRPVFETMLYKLKCKYNRERPRHVCAAVAQPMFDSEADKFRRPDHPSFPGGHATMAYLLAKLLEGMFPQHAGKLTPIADAIVLNREIAGFHFRSDSEAGKKLGSAMAAMILDPDKSPGGNAQMGANRAYLRELIGKL